MADKPLSEQLREYIETLSGEELVAVMTRAADAVGLRALEIVGDTYPPEPPQQLLWRGKAWSLDKVARGKQQRWWWAMMQRLARGGEVPESLRGWKAAYKTVAGRKTLVISGQYKRTGTLVRSMDYHVGQIGHAGVTVEIGPTMARGVQDTDLGYAKYVIGTPPDQARIHQDRWTPLEELIADNEGDLFRVFMDALMRELDSRL